jgi:hypothetical protein
MYLLSERTICLSRTLLYGFCYFVDAVIWPAGFKTFRRRCTLNFQGWVTYMSHFSLLDCRTFERFLYSDWRISNLRHKTQGRSAKFGVGTLRCQTIWDCFSEWPGDQGVDSLQGHHIQTVSWVHTASSAGSTGGWFPWPLASSGAYVMNTCSCTSTPPYISWHGT